MNTSSFNLSVQAINLLNAVETIADAGNPKAEKLLQPLLNRIKRRNQKARQGEIPALLVAKTTLENPHNTPVVDELIANLETLLAAYHADQQLFIQDSFQGRH